MLFMVNGQFTLNGRNYWRIDDLHRLAKMHDDLTYDPIAWLKGFDMAITCDMPADTLQFVVDAINKVLLSLEHCNRAATLTTNPVKDDNVPKHSE